MPRPTPSRRAPGGAARRANARAELSIARRSTSRPAAPRPRPGARGDPVHRRRAAEPRDPRRRGRAPGGRRCAQAIERLVADYDGRAVGRAAHRRRRRALPRGIRRGFELREVGGGWRIYVRERVRRRSSPTSCCAQTPTRLSQAALETLAVIAYKQPIIAVAIASIRAVNVDSVVRTLLGRGLITEVFTDAETGAIHYGTTDAAAHATSASTRSTSCRTSRRCSTTARRDSTT